MRDRHADPISNPCATGTLKICRLVERFLFPV